MPICCCSWFHRKKSQSKESAPPLELINLDSKEKYLIKIVRLIESISTPNVIDDDANKVTEAYSTKNTDGTPTIKYQVWNDEEDLRPYAKDINQTLIAKHFDFDKEINTPAAESIIDVFGLMIKSDYNVKSGALKLVEILTTEDKRIIQIRDKDEKAFFSISIVPNPEFIEQKTPKGKSPTFN